MVGILTGTYSTADSVEYSTVHTEYRHTRHHQAGSYHGAERVLSSLISTAVMPPVMPS